MFSGAKLFNQSLNQWDISNVVGMTSMFYDAISFDMNNALWYNEK